MKRYDTFNHIRIIIKPCLRQVSKVRKKVNNQGIRQICVMFITDKGLCLESIKNYYKSLRKDR